jgi:hypothetical protein
MKDRCFRSNGEDSARAYAAFPVPRQTGSAPEIARVVIRDPRRVATLRSERRRGPGPRDPEQTTWQGPRPLEVETPDGRPVHKAQRFFVDPELYEQWKREEEARKWTHDREGSSFDD